MSGVTVTVKVAHVRLCSMSIRLPRQLFSVSTKSLGAGGKAI